jgi:hypothetical protein
MKLRVQVIKDHEEYHRLYQLWEDDPLIHQKPDIDIEYENMVICDTDIYAYKITKSLGRDGQNDIIIYTDAPHFEVISVDYDKDVEEFLDQIIYTHNMKFNNYKLD